MGMKGRLVIREIDGTTKYFAAYENLLGQTKEIEISEANVRFDRQKALDGDELEFELVGGVPRVCVVPGKEVAGEPEQTKKGKLTRRDSRTSVPPEKTQEKMRSAPVGHGGHVRGGPPALCDAVAPFNFIPFETVIPAFTDEERVWSGKIVCRLTAKTPFLVCGKQEKATDDKPALCSFLEVNGKKIIPGTSIKGMLRSLLEILSFSNMLPVSDQPLFWRRVDRESYRDFFPGEVRGGYLRKYGAEYTLVKTIVIARDKHDGKNPGCEEVRTGGIRVRGRESKVYDFRVPPQDAKGLPVSHDLVNNLWAQITPDQEKRWPEKTRDKLLSRHPGLPVFYRESRDGGIAELGFCRFFRLRYDYTPYKLAYWDGVEVRPDFADLLFGTAEKDSSRKGRVSVSPAVVDGGPYRKEGMVVVLGGPKPTCLPLYLVQDPQRVERMKRNKDKNDVSTMLSYNDPSARLRGRKLYWHHDVDDGVNQKYAPGAEILAKPPEERNWNVISRLFPVAGNSRAQIVIFVDHLTDTELGGLLEAIELPEGHAHKLGMGKSLGLGSVRLEIEKAEVADMRKVHASLASRLEGAGPSELDGQKRHELREHFRRRVLEAVKSRNKGWAHVSYYDDLPPIRTLRLMMDYDNRPSPGIVRTMALKHKDGKSSKDDRASEIMAYENNAILPGPEEVLRKR